MAESESFLFVNQLFGNATYEALFEHFVDFYTEHQSVLWTRALLIPIALIVFPVAVIYILVYITALYLKAYRFYYKILGRPFTAETWEWPMRWLAYLWLLKGRFWYGYEIKGFENIPSEGPALIIFYHGALDVDYFYFAANTIFYKNRVINSVADRFLFKIPGLDAKYDCLQVSVGTFDNCIEILKKGRLLGIAPGGLRETLFGDETYPLVWETRKGFAKVAMKAKVPIILLFTRNIREAFFTVTFGRKWWRWFYEKVRLPIVPILGGFPVKLTTFVGEPIPYDPDITYEELAKKVADKMRAMIKEHQQLPGSICRGVLERFKHLFSWNQS